MTSFIVDGILSGFSVAPPLEWSDDSTNTWTPVPSAGVTATTFRFTHPNISAGGSHTVKVREVGVPSVSGTSPSFTVTPASTGAFQVVSGKIVGPSGATFIARGINVFPGSATASQVMSTFPGINVVRLACQTSDTASNISAFVTGLTNAGVVCLIEHHAGISGGNNIPTGTALTTQQNWFTSVAQAFGSNPNVWFGTMNEPDNSTDHNSVAINQQTTYNTIRGAGATNLILLQLRGGFTADFAAANASFYAAMTNVVWDAHFYNWISGFSTNQATVTQWLQNEVLAGPSHTIPGSAAMLGAQNVQSADGVVPVIIGEYGPSTSGNLPDDAGGQLAVLAVQASVGGITQGCLAWMWHAGAADQLVSSGTTKTTYGQEVAAWIAGQDTSSFGTTFSP
jgi:hypothetical protein